MYENSPQMWPRLGNIFGSLLTATASCLPYWVENFYASLAKKD